MRRGAALTGNVETWKRELEMCARWPEIWKVESGGNLAAGSGNAEISTDRGRLVPFRPGC
jgi:hypothetical protein